MSTKQSLADLFQKAGLRPGATNAHTRIDAKVVKRELCCRFFAEAYVRAGFDPEGAYKELRRTNYTKKKQHAWWWMRQRRVQRYIRELVQEATEDTKGILRLDLAELTQINEALVSADICDYIETGTEVIQGTKEGEQRVRVFNRLAVDPSKLTLGQRMSIKKLTIKEGEVTSVEIVDKMAAMAMQIGLIDLLKARGGSDNTWVGSFQARMSAARKARIEAEVKAGKVAILPTAKKA